MFVGPRAPTPCWAHAQGVQTEAHTDAQKLAPTLPIAINQGLGFYRTTFSRLSAPTGRALRGRFRAVLVGPWWLRLLAGPSIALCGLREWFGKQLSGPGDAHNLVGPSSDLRQTLPMTLSHRASALDGAPCGVLLYSPQSPFPFRHVVDELRAVNDDCLLGMTLTDAPLLRHLPFPFLLVRAD